jgi:hypothetical protein
MPSVEERPAKQWPPLRVTVRKPKRFANEIDSETSSGVSHSTTAHGYMSRKFAVAGFRVDS